METTFLVKVKLPSGVTKLEMEQYIRDSVRSMKGCLPPDDLIFQMPRESFTVKSTTAED